jgi:hypothetical protein
LASYSAYEHSFSAKPTIFKSNIKLKLKSKKDITSNKAHMANGSYNRRSAIPYTLIKDYLQQVLDYINANKF